MASTSWAWWTLVFCACGRNVDVCPRAADTPLPVWADTNADGTVDVDDGVRIARFALAGGAPVACRGQGVLWTDEVGAGDVAFESAGLIWSWLFLGSTTTLQYLWTCDVRNDLGPPPECAAIALSVEAADRATGASGTTASFEARVRLAADGIAPDAWSFGVGAEGCTITAVTRSGTAADGTFADPPGIVDEGFAVAETVAGGAVSAVVPSWMLPTTLDASGEGRDVLALTVEATVPGSGCSACALSLRDDLKGRGQPVATVVGSSGWSFAPTIRGTTVEVCAE